jgi:hypothetical protein
MLGKDRSREQLVDKERGDLLSIALFRIAAEISHANVLDRASEAGGTELLDVDQLE